MKVTIEISCDGAAFRDSDLAMSGELSLVLSRVPAKVRNIMARDPGVLCDAPEVDDVIIDSNGNTVGSIKVDR